MCAFLFLGLNKHLAYVYSHFSCEFLKFKSCASQWSPHNFNIIETVNMMVILDMAMQFSELSLKKKSYGHMMMVSTNEIKL